MYTLQGTSRRDQSQGLVPSCVPTFKNRRAQQIRKISLSTAPDSIALITGAFHSTKNSGLKFRTFHVVNGTVNREIFRMVIPARVDRAVTFSFGQKFSEIYDREVLQTEIFSNGTVISDQNGPTEKAVNLERWTFFFRKFSGWSERFLSVLDRNFRKFWLNGKRPTCDNQQEPISKRQFEKLS